MLVLHLDNSQESETLKRAIIDSEKPFKVQFYNKGTRTDLPGIELSTGVRIWGWQNIRLYMKLYT